MAVQTQIRLSKTPEIEKVLLELKKTYPLLSEVEILKLSLSETYNNLKSKENNNSNPYLSKTGYSILDPEFEKVLLQTKLEIQNGESFVGNAEEAVQWLES